MQVRNGNQYASAAFAQHTAFQSKPGKPQNLYISARLEAWWPQCWSRPNLNLTDAHRFRPGERGDPVGPDTPGKLRPFRAPLRHIRRTRPRHRAPGRDERRADPT